MIVNLRYTRHTQLYSGRIIIRISILHGWCMEVLSSQVQGSQLSETLSQHSVQNSNETPDSVFKTLMQNAAGDNNSAPTEDPEIKFIIDEKKLSNNTEQQDPTDNPANFMFTQMNYLAIPEKEETIQNSDSKPDEKLAKTVTNPVNIPPLAEKEQKEKSTSQTTQAAQKPEVDTTLLTNMSEDTKDLSFISDKLLKQKIENPKESNPMMQSLLKDSLVTSDSIKQIINQPIGLLTDTKSSASDQQTKYLDAMSQLGHSIGNHVSQHLAELDIKPSTLLPTADKSYSEIAAHAKSKDPEVTVELVPLTKDALVKQSYDAKIKIYPPELGHVLAKLKVTDNNAQLVITAENTRVKEVIESNLAQLRETFQKADIQLTSILVNTGGLDFKEQSQQGTGNHEQMMSKNDTIDVVDEKNTPIENKKKLNTLIDTYA